MIHSGVAGAVETEGSGRVGGQPLRLDVLTAAQAFPEFAGVEPFERRIDSGDLGNTTLFRRLGHGLPLERVHARQSPDALLIEGDNLATFDARLAQGFQFGASGHKRPTGTDVIHDGYDNSPDRTRRQGRRKRDGRRKAGR